MNRLEVLSSSLLGEMWGSLKGEGMVCVHSFVPMSPVMVRTSIVQEQDRYLERSSLCLFSLKKKKKKERKKERK